MTCVDMVVVETQEMVSLGEYHLISGWGGGGQKFLPGHFCTSQRRWTIIFHLKIGSISTMPCGHLFISPIFFTKIFIS